MKSKHSSRTVSTFLLRATGIRRLAGSTAPSPPVRYLFLVGALLLAVGCGGGAGGGSGAATSNPGGSGSAVVRITWPARNRLIPAAANSIVVDLILNGTQVSTQTIPRPPIGTNTTQTTFSNLAYGIYTTNIEAFPNTDGSGNAQATGTGTMTVGDGAPGTVSVSMTSTVATLTFSPTNPNVNKLASTTLTASAQDIYGNVVLLTAPAGGSETLTWTSDNTNVATITGTGPTATLTGVHSGSCNVTANFTTNNFGATVTGTTPVTINPISDGTGTVTIQ